MFDALTSVLRDLDLDEIAIQGVIKSLTDTSEDLGDNSFERLGKITPANFGGTNAAAELGLHHEKAHLVIDDTIKGITRDLEDFRDSVRDANRLVTGADENAADDLNRRRAAAESLDDVSRHSHGDEMNHESRNEHLGAPAQSPTPAPTGDA